MNKVLINRNKQKSQSLNDEFPELFLKKKDQYFTLSYLILNVPETMET